MKSGCLLAAGALILGLTLAPATDADAATVFTGEIVMLQGDALIEPGTRVVQVLHQSQAGKCGGDGCGEDGVDYT